eukprot:1344613-Rhodomonas_salina.3
MPWKIALGSRHAGSVPHVGLRQYETWIQLRQYRTWCDHKRTPVPVVSQIFSTGFGMFVRLHQY